MLRLMLQLVVLLRLRQPRRQLGHQLQRVLRQQLVPPHQLRR
jgi:hypothetical protein